MAGTRRDIEFQTVDGIMLRGWFYPAATGTIGKTACIIMAHGLSGLKEQFLSSFASRFNAAGYAALVYDNRNWGDSDGRPRNETDPLKQARDYSDAFDYAATLPEVDASRIVFWGSSLSGGCVITAAAQDKRAKAVIVQVPFVSGESTAPFSLPLLPEVHVDRQAIKRGETGATLPVVAVNPEDARNGSQAVLQGPGVFEFLQEMRLNGITWETQITMQSVMNVLMFEPQAFIHRVSPTPLLMVVADSDTIVSMSGQLKAFSMAYEPKELAILKDCTHFDPYYASKFEENIAVQIRFLQENV